MYIIMHLHTGVILIPPFQLVSLKFLFYCLMALAKTSRTALNNSGESGYACRVLVPSGNASSFFPLIVMLALGLSTSTLFIMLKNVLFITIY